MPHLGSFSFKDGTTEIRYYGVCTCIMVSKVMTRTLYSSKYFKGILQENSVKFLTFCSGFIDFNVRASVS